MDRVAGSGDLVMICKRIANIQKIGRCVKDLVGHMCQQASVPDIQISSHPVIQLNWEGGDQYEIRNPNI